MTNDGTLDWRDYSRLAARVVGVLAGVAILSWLTAATGGCPGIGGWGR